MQPRYDRFVRRAVTTRGRWWFLAVHVIILGMAVMWGQVNGYDAALVVVTAAALQLFNQLSAVMDREEQNLQNQDMHRYFEIIIALLKQRAGEGSGERGDRQAVP